MKRITGRLTEKNGKWYAVINLYTPDGKRKEKWQGLDLEAKRGSKTEANHRLTEILARYNTGELYLIDTMTRAEQERTRTANMLVHDYVVEWLESYRNNIAVLTYATYKNMVDTRIIPYFKELNLTVKDITGDELNAYYNYLIDEGLKGITAQKHHALLHLAFKHANRLRVTSREFESHTLRHFWFKIVDFEPFSFEKRLFSECFPPLRKIVFCSVISQRPFLGKKLRENCEMTVFLCLVLAFFRL